MCKPNLVISNELIKIREVHQESTTIKWLGLSPPAAHRVKNKRVPFALHYSHVSISPLLTMPHSAITDSVTRVTDSVTAPLCLFIMLHSEN